MRRTVSWISETLRLYPERDRLAVIQEAQIRFDLSPREAEFIIDKLGKGELKEDA
ncbi:MAG: hypothetical protein P8Y63_13955 [Deltaproteobacteria bacterium]